MPLDGLARAAGPDRGAPGLGWYGSGSGPAVYRSVAPAWADANLRELAAHIESPLFLAHIRAAIGSPVQQTNCHPFRHGRWLFVHNGFIADLHLLRRADRRDPRGAAVPPADALGARPPVGARARQVTVRGCQIS